MNHRTLSFNFQAFSGPNSFSGTFQVLEILEKKFRTFHDFPGGMGTLTDALPLVQLQKLPHQAGCRHDRSGSVMSLYSTKSYSNHATTINNSSKTALEQFQPDTDMLPEAINTSIGLAQLAQHICWVEAVPTRAPTLLLTKNSRTFPGLSRTPKRFPGLCKPAMSKYNNKRQLLTPNRGCTIHY